MKLLINISLSKHIRIHKLIIKISNIIKDRLVLTSPDVPLLKAHLKILLGLCFYFLFKREDIIV